MLVKFSSNTAPYNRETGRLSALGESQYSTVGRMTEATTTLTRAEPSTMLNTWLVSRKEIPIMRGATLKVVSCLISVFALAACGDPGGSAQAKTGKWVSIGVCPSRDWDQIKNLKKLDPYDEKIVAMCYTLTGGQAPSESAGQFRCKDGHILIRCE